MKDREIKVQLIRSLISIEQNQKECVKALGLKRVWEVKSVIWNKHTNGIVAKVQHLIRTVR